MATEIIETDDYCLSEPDAMRQHHLEIFDLSGCIQFALIHALGNSADANGYKFKTESRYDGFYKFKGSIDTYLISRAIERIVKEKMAFDRTKQLREMG